MSFSKLTETNEQGKTIDSISGLRGLPSRERSVFKRCGTVHQARKTRYWTRQCAEECHKELKFERVGGKAEGFVLPREAFA